jgi:hypothetical protein
MHDYVEESESSLILLEFAEKSDSLLIDLCISA